jgi:hypothetical protein
MTDADLNFLARQSERILTEIASLRDDMAVLTAMVLRLDGSHSALLQETRATHAQIARMNDRVRKLEEGEVQPLRCEERELRGRILAFTARDRLPREDVHRNGG